MGLLNCNRGEVYMGEIDDEINGIGVGWSCDCVWVGAIVSVCVGDFVCIGSCTCVGDFICAGYFICVGYFAWGSKGVILIRSCLLSSRSICNNLKFYSLFNSISFSNTLKPSLECWVTGKDCGAYGDGNMNICGATCVVCWGGNRTPILDSLSCNFSCAYFICDELRCAYYAFVCIVSFYFCLLIIFTLADSSPKSLSFKMGVISLLWV